MADNTNKTVRILTVFVALLITFAVLQTIYMVQLHQQVAGNHAEAAVSSAQAARGNPPGKPTGSWKLDPNATAQQPIDPFNIGTAQPVDPNSWDPFKEMEKMQQQMDQMFEQAFGRFHQSPNFGNLAQGFAFNPKTDIAEKDNEYIVRVDIPGIDSSKVNVTIEDRTLTISGAREEETTNNGAGKLLGKERRLGQFERVITLPGPVKKDGMKANYKDGVLTVTIAKDTAAKQKDVIPVQ